MQQLADEYEQTVGGRVVIVNPDWSERRRLGGGNAARLLHPARALGGTRDGRGRLGYPPLGHARPIVVVRRGAGRIVGRGARRGAHHVPHRRDRRACASVLALPCRARWRRPRRGRRRRLRAGAVGHRARARPRTRRGSPRRGRPRRAARRGHRAARGTRARRQRERHGRAASASLSTRNVRSSRTHRTNCARR